MAATRGHFTFLQKLGRWPKLIVKGGLVASGSAVGFGLGKVMGVEIMAERFVTEQPNSVVTMIVKHNLSQGKGYVLLLYVFLIHICNNIDQSFQQKNTKGPFLYYVRA